MNSDASEIKKNTENLMNKTLDCLEKELSKIRAGKATSSMLDGINVNYYGSMVPVNQIATITIADPKTVLIQPWEKSSISVIEKAILMSNIGVTPQNDGHLIRIIMPPLTEERRKDLVKSVMNEAENFRMSIRNIRRESIEEVKVLQKNGLSEDDAKNSEKEIQLMTDKFINLINMHVKEKEKEIMKI